MTCTLRCWLAQLLRTLNNFAPVEDCYAQLPRPPSPASASPTSPSTPPGPFAGMILASLGADVIKVESAARLDITRRPHAMYGKPPSSFEQVNAGKRSVTLNLKEPRALNWPTTWFASPMWRWRISGPA